MVGRERKERQGGKKGRVWRAGGGGVAKLPSSKRAQDPSNPRLVICHFHVTVLEIGNKKLADMRRRVDRDGRGESPSAMTLGVRGSRRLCVWTRAGPYINTHATAIEFISSNITDFGEISASLWPSMLHYSDEEASKFLEGRI